MFSFQAACSSLGTPGKVMKLPVIVALLLSLLSIANPGAAQPASQMQQDVDRLIRAAAGVTDTWPRQAPPPIREVAPVARHGKAVVPLLMDLLSDNPNWEREGGRWKVHQQVTLALSRIYAQGEYCGRIYCDGDPPERIANVKTGWRNVIAADEAKLRLSTSQLVERFLQEKVSWQQIEWGLALAENNDRQAVAALASLLADEDRYLRGNAAFVVDFAHSAALLIRDLDRGKGSRRDSELIVQNIVLRERGFRESG